jgi:phage shock protein PspC (stress-responsive transcriptional regulator)
LENNKIIRDKNRIIGGICFSIGKKYKFEPWILRIIFILSSWFLYFPVLLYLILWVIIPNKEKVERRNLKKNQILGTFIGGILGATILCGIFYIDSTYANYRPKNDKFIGMIMSVIVGFPIGMVIGFTIVRSLAEKKRNKTNT